MEHRYSTRTPSDIRTLIYKQGLPVCIGRIGNVSNHGAFIDCEAIDVELNQPLEIEFLWHGRKAENSGRFKCFVVRKAAQGIALCLFDEFQSSFSRYAAYIASKQRASVTFPRIALPQYTAAHSVAYEKTRPSDGEFNL